MNSVDTRIGLHAHLHGIVQEQLAPALHDLFDELDTRLFNLAERSRSSVQQHQYFDALRRLRFERVNVETEFLQLANQALIPAPGEVEQAPAPRGLELLAKEEQEETLQLELRTQRLSEQLMAPLVALLARLSELEGTEPPHTPTATALSPRGIGRAFRATLATVDITTEVRLIALNLFGQHVLQILEPLYAQLNATLREAGILPDLVESAPVVAPGIPRPSPARVPRPIPEAESNTVTPPAAPPAPPEPRPDGNELRIGQLHQLVGQYRQTVPTIAGPPVAGTSPLGLINLAASDSESTLLDGGTLDAALDALWTYDGDPLQFKPQLLAEARHHARLEHVRLSRNDEDVIDMIGLLFHRIRNDAELPESMRQLLSRMHMPFLRTALKEQDLLHGRIHPARELLDELGNLAMGWCKASDPDGSLVKQIALTVEQLASHRGSVHATGYAEARRALLLQQEAQARRAELAEQRAIETTIGRERLELARSRVARVIQARLARCEPLPWVRQLLTGPWSHHLALLWLRSSESSPGFHQALDFVDELLWLDQVRPAPEHAERLARAGQLLPEQLRDGLVGIALHDREIATLVDRLKQFIAGQSEGTIVPDFLFENDPTLVQANFSNAWQQDELEEQPSGGEVQPALLAKLQTLVAGTWFEFFPDPAAEVRRAKLCWVSPYSGHYLFVNRNGSKTRELTAAELIAEMESKLARMLDDQRLLERNLRSLIVQLRDNLDQSEPDSIRH